MVGQRATEPQIDCKSQSQKHTKTESVNQQQPRQELLIDCKSQAGTQKGGGKPPIEGVNGQQLQPLLTASHSHKSHGRGQPPTTAAAILTADHSQKQHFLDMVWPIVKRRSHAGASVSGKKHVGSWGAPKQFCRQPSTNHAASSCLQSVGVRKQSPPF